MYSTDGEMGTHSTKRETASNYTSQIHHVYLLISSSFLLLLFVSVLDYENHPSPLELYSGPVFSNPSNHLHPYLASAISVVLLWAVILMIMNYGAEVTNIMKGSEEVDDGAARRRLRFID